MVGRDLCDVYLVEKQLTHINDFTNSMPNFDEAYDATLSSMGAGNLSPPPPVVTTRNMPAFVQLERMVAQCFH